MTTNTRFSMAVHIMTALAYLDARTSSELLSQTVNTNPVVIRRLLRDLALAGLILAERGKHGGFRLARDPGTISLRDIHRAVQAGQPLVGLHENPENAQCAVSCKVRPVLATHLAHAQQAFETSLADTSLTDIVQAM